MQKTFAFIAHDAKKDELADWVGAHLSLLEPHRLVATGTTGGILAARYPSLHVTRMKSGPLGGDQQIGAMVAEGRIDVVVFFIDPMSPMPHDVDVKALQRLAVVYDVPLALSAATASLLAKAGAFAA